MNPNKVPTKGNLMKAKNSYALAKQGYELMDRKRNILIRELTQLIEEAKSIQTEIDRTFSEAYDKLKKANLQLGVANVRTLALSVPEETGVRVKTRSIMGAEIPLVSLQESFSPYKPPYALYRTRPSLDEARAAFEKVKALIIRLSSVEISAYQLASNIQKTQKRANALKNITLPQYEHLISDISNALEEKEREEFTRLKVLKSWQEEG
ncbi:MAG: V-type ATP synthase subunit D [Lachnospiraceae bacterium]|nr:V-type ATP synthase subunit D [Lachnospiraceae bacterium]